MRHSIGVAPLSSTLYTPFNAESMGLIRSSPYFCIITGVAGAFSVYVINGREALSSLRRVEIWG